jgi:hypothetical protein
VEASGSGNFVRFRILSFLFIFDADFEIRRRVFRKYRFIFVFPFGGRFEIWRETSGLTRLLFFGGKFEIVDEVLDGFAFLVLLADNIFPLLSRPLEDVQRRLVKKFNIFMLLNQGEQ